MICAKAEDWTRLLRVREEMRDRLSGCCDFGTEELGLLADKETGDIWLHYFSSKTPRGTPFHLLKTVVASYEEAVSGTWRETFDLRRDAFLERCRNIPGRQAVTS